MGKSWILGQSYIISLCLIFLRHVCVCDSQEQVSNTFTVSSFAYPSTVLRPYDWRYIRVELPPFFLSMSLTLESDVDLDLNKIHKASESSLPMICIREGSPPLPDVHNTSLGGLGKNFAVTRNNSIFIQMETVGTTKIGSLNDESYSNGRRFTSAVIDYISNDSFIGTQSLQNAEKCYPVQKNIQLRVTNEQIYPGTWYFGLFNGIGPIRTQSKMINRGSVYSFSGNISVDGCMTSMMTGQFCNQTVYMLSCSDNYSLNQSDLDLDLFKRTDRSAFCTNANGIVCHEDAGPKSYTLDVIGTAEELIIMASNVTFSSSQASNITRSGALMVYARHGAMPLKSVFDFYGDISKGPLVIQYPKTGRWYLTVQPIDVTNRSEGVQSSNLGTCYLLGWQVFQCPVDKAGLSCTSQRYVLQTVLKRSPTGPFESSYLPTTGKVSSDSARFPLEPLLTNFSGGQIGNDGWTFFEIEIPSGATGGNIHVQLSSTTKINYEIYARYGGLPSFNNWDYFYANGTSNSNSSMFFKFYDLSEEKISFYIMYVRGGTWNFGLRPLNPTGFASQTDISFSLVRCPEKCSSHGTCQSILDTSGLMLYSYCSCDRNHGGIDCGVEIVSHQGHIRQSIFLIASNAAAILPAYWALRNKAFAEWVLFTSSGVSSALYHACDVGTWCVLTFRVLQFMDFWLSFMAVVSTFVYLTSISETSKRTIHTVMAILTALMAQIGPTRSSNITYVIGIGALGLLVGWLVEFSTHYRTFSFSGEFHLNLLERWETFRGWIHKLIKTIVKRFRWGFLIAGFAALAFAATSWKVETTENYWFWHSMWHLSIYTSSFLFLCSKAKVAGFDNERSSDGNYELTRQNSFSGGEPRNEL